MLASELAISQNEEREFKPFKVDVSLGYANPAGSGRSATILGPTARTKSCDDRSKNGSVRLGFGENCLILVDLSRRNEWWCPQMLPRTMNGQG